MSVVAAGSPPSGGGVTSLVDCLTKDTEAEIRKCAERYEQDSCIGHASQFDMYACIRPPNGATVNVSACRKASDDFAFEHRNDLQECLSAITAKVDAVITAEKSCLAFGQLSACAALPDDAVYQKCLLSCISAREPLINATVAAEEKECESRYIDPGGRGKFNCSFPDAMPGVDEKKLAIDFKAAILAHDGPALDASFKLSADDFLARSQSDCTKTCNERGPNLAAAQKQGPALVKGYKRCMVSADSTPEARKLDAYEITLYCDYRKKADARCRTASRCDWLEQYSSERCEYVTPGDRCP